MIPVKTLLSLREEYKAKCAEIKTGDKYPFYSFCCKNVPGYKTLKGNLAFRKAVLERAGNDLSYKNDLYAMCGRDMLFYINTFAFTYDPRLIPKPAEVPFITYDFQDVGFDEIKKAIEVGFDQLSEKSRDMGLSWMYLTAFTWMWHFRPYTTFRMLSRNEDLVDKSDDPDALYWKILYLIKHLPKWLSPNYRKVHLNLLNLDNEATIGGCSTTSDAARGGRCTAMLPDEFAAVPDGHGMLSSTRDVTKCRLFNSTHKGAGTAFYRLSVGKIRKLVIHWSIHPEKAKGLYCFRDGKLERYDDFKGEVTVNGTEYTFPDNYPFRDDGKLRSPWYDNECDRAVHPMEIAQELDIDPFSSDFQFFDGNIVEEIKDQNVKRPYIAGFLEFDEDSLDPIEFVENENGDLKLWINRDAYGHFPQDLEVACGADISAGTGASNSALAFGNIGTGEKIAEYASPWIKPEAFAKLTIALCRWLNNAFLVPDGGGPGRTYCDELIKLGFRRLYYRRNEEGLTKKVSDKPGVFLNAKEKSAVMGAYRRALKEKTFIQRSDISNDECLSYVYTIGNSIEHSASLNSIDPSGAKDNHGDRVIADALLNKAYDFFGTVKEPEKKTEPTNCYASRKKAYEKNRKNQEAW